MKRYIVFLLMFILAIGAVSASDYFGDMIDELNSYAELDVNFTDSDTNVTIDDLNFTIPKGFGEIDMLSVNVSGNNDSQNVKFFTNANHDVIMISLTSSEDINQTIYTYASEEGSYENATIEGHDGVKWSNDSYSLFVYRENNSAVVLQAPDDTYFEKMII